MNVMWPPTALHKAATIFMKTKCKSNVLELYLYLIGLTNWIVSLLKFIIKQIQTIKSSNPISLISLGKKKISSLYATLFCCTLKIPITFYQFNWSSQILRNLSKPIYVHIWQLVHSRQLRKNIQTTKSSNFIGHNIFPTHLKTQVYLTPSVY
jgi:hypothetical protein